MIKVFIARHPTEAHLVAGVLESHGIRTLVRGEALFGARGEAPLTSDTLPSVWVLSDDDSEDALELIRGRPMRPEECWTCRDCGELVEPQFDACWRCSGKR